MWAGDKLIAVGKIGRVVTSTDGDTWQHIISGAELRSVSVAGNKIIAAGANGLIAETDDLESVSLHHTGSDHHYLYGIASDGTTYVAWANNQFVAVGAGG